MAHLRALMAERSRIRVSIVEDDAILREALVDAVQDDPALMVCDAFADGEAFITSLIDDVPEVVIMDLNLPRMSGITCIQQLKAARPNVQVLVCTCG